MISKFIQLHDAVSVHLLPLLLSFHVALKEPQFLTPLTFLRQPSKKSMFFCPSDYSLGKNWLISVGD